MTTDQTRRHLEREIAYQRAELGHTVESLAASLSVKRRMRSAVAGREPLLAGVAAAIVAALAFTLWKRSS